MIFWPAKYEETALYAAYLGYPEFAFEAFNRELQYTTVRYGTLWLPCDVGSQTVAGIQAVRNIDANLVDYWRMHGWGDFCRPRGRVEFSCD